jgi:hypothetical protein
MGRKKTFKTPEQYAADFWKRVDKTDSCWLWTGALHSAGYGVVRINACLGSQGDLVYAHRYAYELLRGRIPDGLFLDHLCRVRNCCNPDHLEPVTHQVNLSRGLGAKKSHCSRGHEMTGDNVYIRPDTGGRQCLTCKHEYWDEWYGKNKEKVAARSKAKSLEAV